MGKSGNVEVDILCVNPGNTLKGCVYWELRDTTYHLICQMMVRGNQHHKMLYGGSPLLASGDAAIKVASLIEMGMLCEAMRKCYNH